jgi:hypothetical protein
MNFTINGTDISVEAHLNPFPDNVFYGIHKLFFGTVVAVFAQA